MIPREYEYEEYNEYPYIRSRDTNFEKDDRETIERSDGDEYEEYRFPENIALSKEVK